MPRPHGAASLPLTRGIATPRKPGVILSMLLVPLLVWLMTPFIRPFRLSRLIFTYLAPLMPFAAMFDGVVSCLRTYTPLEIEAMTATLQAQDYRWQTGEERLQGSPGIVTDLIGIPIEAGSAPSPRSA